MNTIDWLRSACDPAVVLDTGYKTSPYEFLIGLCVWRTGQLLPFPECLLSLLALPPPVSQGWWCHSAGPHYWIRAISCTAWFSESKSDFFFRCHRLTSSHVLFVLRWHHRITSRCSKLKSFLINCIPHDTKRMCHSELASLSIFQEKECFQKLKEKLTKAKLLRSTVSGTFQYLSS